MFQRLWFANSFEGILFNSKKKLSKEREDENWYFRTFLKGCGNE
jgi:hypothetical protein